MYTGSLSTGSISEGIDYYKNWLYSGAFAGVFSGKYGSSLNYLGGFQGSSGYFWSSSTSNAVFSNGLDFRSQISSVSPGTYLNYRYEGLGVRCVISS
jgi:hypothetical protein